MSLSLRPAVPADEQFLYELVYQVMFEQLYAHTWPPQFREQLLNQQIQAKHNSYAFAHPGADHGIVVVDDKPVGRLIVDRSGEFHNLVDIAILPQYRCTGIGTRLLVPLCNEAQLSQRKTPVVCERLQSACSESVPAFGFPRNRGRASGTRHGTCLREVYSIKDLCSDATCPATPCFRYGVPS